MDIEKIGIHEGQVYKNSTSGNELEVVFADDKTVVLETLDGHRRYEPTKQFKNGVGNEWSLEKRADEEHEDDIPEENVYITALKLLEERFENSDEDVTGQKVEAIRMAIEIFENNSTRQIPLTDIGGIGTQNAENLKQKGIRSKIHLAAARDEYIKNTDGIGNKSFENLMEKVD